MGHIWSWKNSQPCALVRMYGEDNKDGDKSTKCMYDVVQQARTTVVLPLDAPVGVRTCSETIAIGCLPEIKLVKSSQDDNRGNVTWLAAAAVLHPVPFPASRQAQAVNREGIPRRPVQAAR